MSTSGVAGVLRRNPSFARLWLAQIVSGLGDELLALAFPFYVFAVTGSATATGAAFVAATIAGVVISPVAGVVVDQVDRRMVIVVSSLFSGCAVLGILLAGRDTIWLAYVALFLLECGARFFAPARSALTPSLVLDEDLLSANALASSTSSLTALVGPAIGGLLFAAAGMRMVVVLDAMSFLAAAALAAGIRTSRRPEPRSDSSPRLRRLRHDLADGLEYTATNPIVRALLLLAVIFGAAIGALNAIAIPFAQDILRVSAGVYGLMLTAEGVGGVLAGLFMPVVAKRMLPRRLIAVCLAVDALCIGTLLWLRSPWLIVIPLTAAGFATVTALASVQTLVHRSVPDSKLGRVGGVTGPVIATGSIVAILSATTAADAFGVLPVLGAITLVMAGAAAVAAVWAGAEATLTEPLPIDAGAAKRRADG